MQQSSNVHLSDYQRAVLNEMGVSCWQKIDQQKISPESVVGISPQPKVEEQTLKVASQKTSSENALARLAALKKPIAEVKTAQKIDSVLFALTNEHPLFLKDVLLAIGLEKIEQISISAEQIPDYSDYPLAWKQADEISVNEKILSTPTLSALQTPSNKKQLWKALQSLIKSQ